MLENLICKSHERITSNGALSNSMKLSIAARENWCVFNIGQGNYKNGWVSFWYNPGKSDSTRHRQDPKL